ncbi:3' terminal RNA ribose 2'-O-methyltransferase Hen1 [Nocardiopsis ansamitocini]|uniref:3' terminal RNA ribose 2'-O-methyltransferase Hen1 n=1 Tax=Nocardiopsis ansamitocini TaxID=1670832 RepID=UPI002553CBD3|nr:3' terminal RNA ribose 2'-O-methyltransferase Hen1 [Nocardiopsis ansamitocini]
MLLTISATRCPVTEFGLLLHSDPDTVQTVEQAHGAAHVFYPEANEQRCTAALLLEVDPLRLRRTRGGRTPDFASVQYVNDQPYAASSLFAATIAAVFHRALNGECPERPERVRTVLDLTLHLPAVPCDGGPGQARQLFEPLGWTVTAEPVPLDPGLPGWGDSRYLALTLTGEQRVADALSHLCVLLPALAGAPRLLGDGREADPLRHAAGWLPGHPHRAQIADPPPEGHDEDGIAVRRLVEVEGRSTGTGSPPAHETPADGGRHADAVLAVLLEENARSVVDLGCGSGRLLALLCAEPTLERITGVDVAGAALRRAERLLGQDRIDEPARLALLTGSVLYRDDRFASHDAAVLMNVVEHIEPGRLPAMEQVVFGHAAPRTVVVTTPEADSAPRDVAEGAGAYRHPDQRFAWTRDRFRAWAQRVARVHGYRVRYVPVGPDDPGPGPATQMGVFTR